jgi:hypothetical protein
VVLLRGIKQISLSDKKAGEQEASMDSFGLIFAYTYTHNSLVKPRRLLGPRGFMRFQLSQKLPALFFGEQGLFLLE